MDNDDRTKLKEELKIELLFEIDQQKKTKLLWTRFRKEELRPLLENRFDTYQSHRICEAIATMCRMKYRKQSSISYRVDEMEDVKKSAYELIEFWFGIRRDNHDNTKN